MKYLIILMTLVTCSSFMKVNEDDHIDKLAEFYLTKNNDQLKVQVIIEEKQLKRLNVDCNIKTTTAFCFKQYIDLHLKIKINNQDISFNLDESKASQGHYILYLSSDQNVDNVNDLIVENNCFITEFGDFRNRVIIGLEGITKSYMLTKSKSSFSLKF